MSERQNIAKFRKIFFVASALLSLTNSHPSIKNLMIFVIIYEKHEKRGKYAYRKDQNSKSIFSSTVEDTPKYPRK